MSAEFSPRSSALSGNLLFSEHRLVAQLGLYRGWNGLAPTRLALLGAEVLGRAEFHSFTGQELDAGLWHGHCLSELSRAGFVL